MQKEKRTYKDRAAYFKQAVARRRRKLKEMLIAYKGGKCIVCGYANFQGALDLHHLDETKRSFGFSQRGMTRSWAKTKEEADKCVLLCANHHREPHGGLVKIEDYLLAPKQ